MKARRGERGAKQEEDRRTGGEVRGEEKIATELKAAKRARRDEEIKK